MTGVSSSASPSPSARPRVVIIGAGFGGLWTAKNLANAAVEIVIIDQVNYHLFQPLLYQVATAGLSPADIAAPLARLERHNRAYLNNTACPPLS
jgi:NADH dehydrogenase